VIENNIKAIPTHSTVATCTSPLGKPKDLSMTCTKCNEVSGLSSKNTFLSIPFTTVEKGIKNPSLQKTEALSASQYPRAITPI